MYTDSRICYPSARWWPHGTTNTGGSRGMAYDPSEGEEAAGEGGGEEQAAPEGGEQAPEGGGEEAPPEE